MFYPESPHLETMNYEVTKHQALNAPRPAACRATEHKASLGWRSSFRLWAPASLQGRK